MIVSHETSMIWLFVIAVIALIVGNLLRRIGVEQARANTYGSTAALAGQRKSGIGNWLNVAGGLCLVGTALWPWL
jgi:hypothetical protein